jgi:serine/threonine protein kinase/tetratricopeptide (TPR) repeat protein
MPLHAGQTISRYRLVEPLGEGGMGVVWRAEDLELHRPVALKFLNEAMLGGEESEARFLREARTAAALNHPGVCTIYEVGRFEEEDEGSARPFIAMELVQGRTLHAIVKERGALPADEVLAIALQVSEALAAAHARGIVHRDLKPANIMITPEGRAKILDFGLAKPQAGGGALQESGTAAHTVSAEVTRDGTIVGTVAYMSPEQAEGKPLDSRSDIFSFGATVYELAAGRVPFRGDTPTSTLAKVLESEPEPLTSAREDLDPGISRVVQRCLRKASADRYNDTRDLVAALREVQEAARSGSGAVQPVDRPSTGGKRWVVPVLATLLLLLVAAVWFRLSRPPEPVVPARPSVAVLPFQNLSSDPDNAYFAAGMTEELVSRLSRMSGLQVAARSSVARYASGEHDPRDIGRELGVGYLLEGGVRRAGDRVKITAQLVDTSSGFQAWSEEYEGTLEDVFRIQESTALKIADRLDLELTPQEEQAVTRRDTQNPEAYDAYLRSQVLLNDWSDRERVESARRYLVQALELDPDYPLALAGLASVDAQIYRNFDSNPERIARAARNAARAAELDPDLPRAKQALGEVAAVRFDYREAADRFREVTRMTPEEPFVWDLLSWALGYQEPPDSAGAVEAAREALRLQPDMPGAYYHMGRALLQLGRNDEAEDAFLRALELNPAFTAAHLGLAQYHLAEGEHEAALADLEIEGQQSAMTQYYRCLILADAGDADGALASLRRALDLGFRDLEALDTSPYLAGLRDDPRLSDLLRPIREAAAPPSPGG